MTWLTIGNKSWSKQKEVIHVYSCQVIKIIGYVARNVLEKKKTGDLICVDNSVFSLL